ncbi:hypothetical protein ACO2Q8_13480 [Larkinella sp. VNQ87]|uniref:hypothetical protein n=1 Tax=Larkinella sp. VNQ87 TaxID=3400921 RepID=UPI003C05D8CE
MKTFASLLLLLLLFGVAQAYAFRTKPERNLATQLSRYLQLPDALRQSRQGAVVLISFRIDADDRLADLQVHTSDRGLNESLARQLVGQKVVRTGPDRNAVQWVRLRFVP